MTRFRLLVITLTLLTSSSAWADLRTYDVDPQYQQEIYAALKQILSTEGGAGVELLPSGQILVKASTPTLDQVEQVLQAIRAQPVAAAPRVELRYWAVLGIRSAAEVASSTRAGSSQTVVTVVPGRAANASGAPPPDMLRDVLAELERVHGDLEFRVLGTAAVVSESGQPGLVEGVPLDVEHRAYVQGDTLNADIQLNLGGDGGGADRRTSLGRVSVRTSLRRGEFVIIGESEISGAGIDGPVFFIVHWPEARTR